MLKCAWSRWLLYAILIASSISWAQEHSPEKSTAEIRLRLLSSLPGKPHAVPGAAWLTPLAGTKLPAFIPQGHYTLLQKNRRFIPHLQVIPVGAVVQFPNADPFYHNVFSLFDGKRFDLGLYEAGSSKSVTFARAGVSYIFCNIHPEMSAVVLTLSTPLYALADSGDAFALHDIPLGDYTLHLWIEGVPQSVLESLGRTVHVTSHDVDLGTITAPITRPHDMTHINMFGKPYNTQSQPTY
jgi:hypothetical protein